MRVIPVTLIALLALNVLIYLLPLNVRHSIISEGGLVEDASVFLHFLGAAVALYYARRRRSWGGVSAAVFFVLFALRELDFHSRLTSMSVTKTRFFISPDVPLANKLLALLVLTAIGLFILASAWRYWRLYLESARRRESWAISVFTGMGIIAFIPLFESAVRNFVGSDASGRLLLVLNTVEETAELLLPVLLIYAILSRMYHSSLPFK